MDIEFWKLAIQYLGMGGVVAAILVMMVRHLMKRDQALFDQLIRVVDINSSAMVDVSHALEDIREGLTDIKQALQELQGFMRGVDKRLARLEAQVARIEGRLEAKSEKPGQEF